MQRDLGLADDAFAMFSLCHDSYAAGTRIPLMRPTLLYNDACIQAQCAALCSSPDRAAERDRFAEEGMTSLRRAIEAG